MGAFIGFVSGCRYGKRKSVVFTGQFKVNLDASNYGVSLCTNYCEEASLANSPICAITLLKTFCGPVNSHLNVTGVSKFGNEGKRSIPLLSVVEAAVAAGPGRGEFGYGICCTEGIGTGDSVVDVLSVTVGSVGAIV